MSSEDHPRAIVPGNWVIYIEAAPENGVTHIRSWEAPREAVEQLAALLTREIGPPIEALIPKAPGPVALFGTEDL